MFFFYGSQWHKYMFWIFKQYLNKGLIFILLPLTILLYSQVFHRCPFTTFATYSDDHLMSLFSLTVPPQPSSEKTLTACSDHRKGLPEPYADDILTLSQPPPPAYYISTSHAFSLASRGSPKRHLLLLPSPCHTPDPPQSWLNAGSFPDALRCQDFEGGTRSQKTLVLETYSYSRERKDSLSKPHPFTATQFPFFVSWLKPVPFFSSSQQHGIWLPAAVPILHPPPAVSALHLLGTSDTSIFSPLWKTLLEPLRL